MRQIHTCLMLHKYRMEKPACRHHPCPRPLGVLAQVKYWRDAMPPFAAKVADSEKVGEPDERGRVLQLTQLAKIGI